MNPDFCVEIDDAEGNNLLTDATAKVQDQNSRLMEVYKKTQQNCNMSQVVIFFIIFVVQVGANVLLDLRKQREQLQRANLALDDTEQDLDQSNRIMNKIFRR